MQDERRTVRVGQAVDHLPDAFAHLVDNQSFIDRTIWIDRFRDLVQLDDASLPTGWRK